MPSQLSGHCGRAVAKEAFEFAAELGGAFVANFKRRSTGVAPFIDHQHARFVQADAFQTLPRRGRNDRFEARIRGYWLDQFSTN
jgi:hypothetical protein